MKKTFSSFVSGTNKYYTIAFVLIMLVFSKQLRKLLDFFRGKLQSAVSGAVAIKKVSQDSGISKKSAISRIREETCKGVASAIFGYLHEKPFGFLPRAIFGSTENEKKIVSELNSLQNGLEAKFVSSYYFQKYQHNLKGLLVKYLSSSDISNIRAEVKNNLL